MTEKNKTPAVNLQPGSCVSYRLRRAARMTAIFYDNALKPIGLRNTQFTLVSSLNLLGEISIGDLSLKLATDGTTLNRNLEILVRRGLVENNQADDGRVRNVKLTRLGYQTYEAALPLWRAAQQQLLKAIEPDPWVEMVDQLSRIEDACHDPG